MIVALAGHVDHGKTSLIKALTGVDTDRLDEERRRGLTIDLGFAYTEIDGARIGFVDVPGHHRFVHNMVAGVASRQLALLVVAANDGVMPQTREHTSILTLLGLERGVVVITKCDLVPEERIATVRTEVASLLAGTFLATAPVIPMSVSTGRGLDELRHALASARRSEAASTDDECFRLAIDRAFNVRGAGLVVTGTVHSGRAALGDELVLTPLGRRVRVRGLRVQDQDASRAHAGDRCALNVAGIERDRVTRGMWLVAPDTFLPTTRIVMQLDVLSAYPRAVRHWAPVQVHHAADHVGGHVSLLDSPPVAPGKSARVEIDVERPLHPKRGDRIVLRDDARGCTLGGGVVIEVAPPRSGRRKASRLARLAVAAAPTASEAMAALLDTDDGLPHESFRLNWNLSPATFEGLLGMHGARTVQLGDETVSFAAARLDAVEARVRERLGSYHRAAPYSPGLRLDQLRQVVGIGTRELEIGLSALQRSHEVATTNGHFHLATHRPKLAPEDEALLETLTRHLDGAQPESIGDIAKSLKRDLRALQTFVDRMAALGLVVRVSESRCFLPGTIDRLTDVARRLSTDDGFTAAQFRDAAGIGRNLAIDVLEYFDRRGLTRRSGDKRRIASAEGVSRSRDDKQ